MIIKPDDKDTILQGSVAQGTANTLPAALSRAVLAADTLLTQQAQGEDATDEAASEDGAAGPEDVGARDAVGPEPAPTIDARDARIEALELRVAELERRLLRLESDLGAGDGAEQPADPEQPAKAPEAAKPARKTSTKRGKGASSKTAPAGNS